MASAVATICEAAKLPKTMSLIGRGLNFIVFNHHSKEQRNQHGTVEEMRELFYLERHLADLINDRMIERCADLVNYMCKKWTDKWCPRELR